MGIQCRGKWRLDSTVAFWLSPSALPASAGRASCNSNQLAHTMNPEDVNQISSQGGGIVATVILLIQLAVLIVTFAGMWKVFTKAGEPGWAAIVPFYNFYVLLKIAGKPWWWLLVALTMCLTIVPMIIAGLGVAKNFGKSEGFGIGLGLLPFIFYPMLGYGDAQFVGQKTP